jgi:hypothetical protein
MLHFVQHDNRIVIPSNSEESIVDASLRLRSVQHDKTVVCLPTLV